MNSDNKEKNLEKPEADMHKSDEFIVTIPKPLRGGLYLVATPIGNLRDITLRALDVLRAADMILCEDTRVTGKLLAAYQIKGKLRSYNDHSEGADADGIVERFFGEEAKGEQVIVLVSDAGMPLVSDPGYKLVQACQRAGVYVTSLPGAAAPLAALQLSGQPSHAFSFLGFLPSKTKARQTLLGEWADTKGSLIAFETAPRLIGALEDIEHVLGQREVAVVREITKLYEEVRKDVPRVLIEHYTQKGLPKGEIVLVIAPPLDRVYSEEDVFDMIRTALETMKSKDAAKAVAEKVGMKKSDVYNLIIAMARGA